MNNYENMVSICCITYNQEKYIAEALDGFLMQNTNFNYEIIIGDDCSTDATRSIIEDYSERYPGKIQLLTNLKNGGATPNILKTLGAGTCYIQATVSETPNYNSAISETLKINIYER